MKVRVKAAAAAVSGIVMSVTVTEAAAQTEIAAGQSIGGVLTDNNVAERCYVLDTEAGSKWVVDLRSGPLDPMLFVGRGMDCGSATWDIQNDDISGFNHDSRIVFESGGGQYLILADRYSGTGEYTVTVNPADAGARATLLPAGLIKVPVLVGAASTTAAAAPESRQPGEVFRDCDTCPEMVAVPAGQFAMGSPADEEGRDSNEGPRHTVTIARAFAMGRFEVTFDEYNVCVAEGRCQAPASGDMGWGQGRRPVIGVTYDDATRYVAWLSARTGQSYFLPSEAEWEYAARAGTDTPWNTGDAIITDDANFLGTFAKTVVVGAYPPNAFNLHDMHGNVWEWTQDCMDTGYLGVPVDGSASLNGNCDAQRIQRGGGFNNDHVGIRSARRHFNSAGGSFYDVGFRVVRAM